MYQLQLPFLDISDDLSAVKEQLLKTYSSDQQTSQQARIELELYYRDILQPTDKFNRRLVSYQANKNTRVHNWLKYKEGFSAKLVETLLNEFGIEKSQSILDPFAGSGTTLLVAQQQGLNATGIDVLPLCHLAWQAKSNYRDYDIQVLQDIRDWVKSNSPSSDIRFPHIPITESAFLEAQESRLMGYFEYFHQLRVDEPLKALLQLVLTSVLEDISFTRKDGQYLRWDSRAKKAQTRDSRRTTTGKAPYKTFHKSKILDVTDAIVEALDRVIKDIQLEQRKTVYASHQELIAGSVLEVLPTIANNRFDAVITSPPYCNRYDYTRTYALELAFLGLNHQAVVDLRQEQLSCTVENRSKVNRLRQFYTKIERLEQFQQVMDALEKSAALQEVFEALEIRSSQGFLNNKGVVQMVKGYFTELAFVTSELFRTCKPGVHVAIVNDNVRYAGEIIPVDLLMTDIAASLGFVPKTIYVLPQQKGNSSQQMGKFGREALRKSIIIWQKPLE